MKKVVEHEGDGITIVISMLRMVPLRLGKGIVSVGSWRKKQDHSDYSIAEIDLNTQKSPGDLKTLAVTHSPVKAF